VPHDGDAADDPAIWVDRQHPSRSVVIGTDKKGGIAVYGLGGHQIQYRPDGKLNNVDLRAGFRLGRRTVTLVAASDRSHDSIVLYRLNATTRHLIRVPGQAIRPGFEPYGACMYRSQANGRVYVIVTSEQGNVQQWWLRPNAAGRVTGTKVRNFDVGSQSEGCVADDRLGRLYLAEENVGLWRYGAEPSSGTARTQVDRTGSQGHLEADVEGLTIAYAPDGGYLVASSQGNSAFAVYGRTGGNDYAGSFTVESAGGVDGVSDTDGIDVTAASLGSSFPGGLFVAQDGHNDGGNQNFKLVRWDRIVAGLGLA
jgi:3-phytase